MAIASGSSHWKTVKKSQSLEASNMNLHKHTKFITTAFILSVLLWCNTLPAKTLYMRTKETPDGIDIIFATTNAKVYKLGNSIVVDVHGQPPEIRPPRSRNVAGVSIKVEDFRPQGFDFIRIAVEPPFPYSYKAKILGNSLILHIKYPKKIITKQSAPKQKYGASRKNRPTKKSKMGATTARGTVAITPPTPPQVKTPTPNQKPQSKLTFVSEDSTGKVVKVEIIGARADAIRYAYELATGKPLPIRGTCRIFIPEGVVTVDSLRKLIEANLINCEPEDTSINK